MRVTMKTPVMLGCVVALSLMSCGESSLDMHEPQYLDHDPGVITAGLNIGQAGGCSTDIARGLDTQLVEELNCISPGLMANASGPHWRSNGAVMAFLHSTADAKLRQATAAANDYITVNSAYRTVAAQQLLYTWWQQGRCGIPLAAAPGSSNHQSGRAIDTSNYNYWRSRLSPYGWTWHGSSDVYHFDCLSAPDLAGRSVLAFQRLWNKNNASKLVEDGVWGPNTRNALVNSPVTGFANHGCAAPPPPVTGTLKGIIYEANPADAADTSKFIVGAVVKVAGKTLTTDATGTYSTALNAGSHAITVTAANYQDGSLTRQVAGGQTIWGSIGLTPKGMPDTTPPDLVVTSPEPEATLDAADVVISGTTSDAMGEVKSLTIAVVTAGVAGEALPVTLAAGAFAHPMKLKPGRNDFQLKATDAKGNARTVDVGLTFHSGLEGEVTTTDNLATPLEGASLTLRDGSGTVLASTVSAPDGHYDFDLTNVPLQGVLTAEKDGYQTFVTEVTITDQARAVFSFALAKGSGITDNPSPIPGGGDGMTEMKVKGSCSAAPGLSFALGALALLFKRRRQR